MSKDRTDYLLDMDEILGAKMSAKLPGFVKRFLKNRLHLDQINDCIMKAEHYAGAGFFDEALDYIGITYKIRGEENLDLSKKYIFACNHPLGGPEALIIGSVFKRIYNYPGAARTLDELRADVLKAKSLIPGSHRLNLHEIYGDFQGKVVDRDEVTVEHFQSWIDWAAEHNTKLDFNSTSFSHPKSGNLSLSNPDESIRKFWVEHTKRCRDIADAMYFMFLLSLLFYLLC